MNTGICEYFFFSIIYDNPPPKKNKETVFGIMDLIIGIVKLFIYLLIFCKKSLDRFKIDKIILIFLNHGFQM